MAGGTTLPIDVQIVNFVFPGAPSAAAALATLILPTSIISAVDVTRSYNFFAATQTGSFRCQGVFPFDGSVGSSCSGLAIPPAGGPIVPRLGNINDGKLSQWRFVITGPTTAVAERSGSPTPLPISPSAGCEHFTHHKIVEYL
jgi:hypothetical protein